jgi:23S rRNA (guanine745-N1)-methyltransferase
VTAAEGGLTVVTPGEGHLAELRAGGWLLGIGGEKTAKLDRSLVGFELQQRSELAYTVCLARGEAVDLVMMGPNAFHHDWAAVAARLDEMEWPLAVSVAVTVSRYWRSAERN